MRVRIDALSSVASWGKVGPRRARYATRVASRVIRPPERERAHQVLDRLLDLLAPHAPSSGVLRLRFDRDGRLHLETRDMVADLEHLVEDPRE